jgi:hypothetical protein
VIDWLIGAGFLLACIAVFFVMRAGWKRRGRRQADVVRPTLAPREDDLDPALLTRDLFYVATTRAADRLDRIVIGGLGFRGRAVVTVHAQGVVLDIAGERPILIAAADLTSVGRSTWTIDRVVETDGLVRLGWRLGDLDVDSYLRDSDGSAALISAIAGIVPGGSAPTSAPTRGDTTP